MRPPRGARRPGAVRAAGRGSTRRGARAGRTGAVRVEEVEGLADLLNLLLGQAGALVRLGVASALGWGATHCAARIAVGAGGRLGVRAARAGRQRSGPTLPSNGAAPTAPQRGHPRHPRTGRGHPGHSAGTRAGAGATRDGQGRDSGGKPGTRYSPRIRRALPAARGAHHRTWPREAGGRGNPAPDSGAGARTWARRRKIA